MRSLGRSYASYSPEQAASLILADIVYTGHSEGWSGSYAERDAVALRLAVFGVRYIDDTLGEWALGFRQVQEALRQIWDGSALSQRYVVDECDESSLDEIVKANADSPLDASDLASLVICAVGASVQVGGGAQAVTVFRRVK